MSRWYFSSIRMRQTSLVRIRQGFYAATKFHTNGHAEETRFTACIAAIILRIFFVPQNFNVNFALFFRQITMIYEDKTSY